MNEEIKEFWKKQLDVLKGANYSYRFIPTDKEITKTERLEISEPIVQRLSAIAGEDKTKLFVLLTSLFQITLARYSQQEEIVIMTPCLNGNENDSSTQFLVPLGTTHNFDSSLGDALSFNGKNCVLSYRYQNFMLQADRDAKSVLSSNLGIYSNAIHGNNSLKGNCERIIEIEMNDRSIAFNFSSSGVASDFTLGFPRMFNTILEQLTDTSVKLCDIAWYNDEQLKERLKVVANGRHEVQSASLVELFEQHVKDAPDAPAITFKDETLTYRAFNERVNRLTDYLQKEYDVQKGECVVLYLDLSMDLYVVILAILKCQAFFVPIRKGIHDQELKLILEGAEGNLIISESQRFEQLTPYQYTVMAIDLESDFSEYNPLNPERTSMEDLPAYAMFTSGSTGVSKGVLINQSSVVNMVVDNPYNKTERNRKILQLSPYYFDGFVFDLFTAFIGGAHLICAEDDMRTNPKKLIDFIRVNEVDQMLVVTPLLNQLADVDPTVFKQFKTIYFGGQEASAVHLQKIYGHLSSSDALIHLYGATENTVLCTAHTITKENLEELKTPIGKPVRGAGILMLDRFGHLVYPYVEGEIFIIGTCVAEGYLNDPERTAERFITLPNFTEEKVFKTGDFGSWNAADEIMFHGRKDGQIQIRGYRIETGEIINQLLQNKNVVEVHLVAYKNDSTGNFELYGYYTGDITPAALKEFAVKVLPDYKIPTVMIQLNDMPLKANGKVDESQLPKKMEITDAFIPPQGMVEGAIAEIWESVFEINGIGRNQDFFELGGQSIKAMQVMMGVAEKLDVDILISDVMSYPVLQDLAAFIDKQQDRKYPPLVSVNESDKYPLSIHQKPLWMAQKSGQRTAYNSVFHFKLQGEINLESLQLAIDKVIEENEVLRTVIREEVGVPYQVILADAKVTLGLERIEENVNAVLKNWIHNEQSLEFDIENGPLFRFRMVFDGNDHFVVFTIHHIIFDPRSLDLLLAEVLTHYKHIEEGSTYKGNSDRLQYRDFSVWHNNLFNSGLLNSQKEYWIKCIEGFNKVNNLDPSDTMGKGEIIHFGSEATQKLERIANSNNATLFSCLYALYHLFMFKNLGIEKLVIATPGSIRLNKEMNDIMGYFVNLIPISSKVKNEMLAGEVIRICNENVRKSLDNRLVSSNVIMDELRSKYGNTFHPFDVTMTYIDQRSIENFSIEVNNKTLTICSTDLDTEHETARFNMEFIAVHLKDELQMQVIYKTSIYAIEDIVEMKEFMLNSISLISANNDIPINELMGSENASDANSKNDIKLNITF